jgi:hypothetical protein
MGFGWAWAWRWLRGYCSGFLGERNWEKRRGSVALGRKRSHGEEKNLRGEDS